MPSPQQNNLHLLREFCAFESLDNYDDLIRVYAGLQVEGKTALMFAAERGALELVRDLVVIGNAVLDDTNEDLVYDSDSEESSYLVQGKESGYTALMYACEQGHEAIAAFLIKSSADCSLKNARKKTALDLAKIAGHQSIINLFPESKQESFLAGNSGEAMQQIARMLSAPFCIAYPLSADAQKEKEFEMTPLKKRNHLNKGAS